MSKRFLLDTSVLAYDPECLTKFDDNHIFIPQIVIQELGGLQNKIGETGFAARDILRQIDDKPKLVTIVEDSPHQSTNDLTIIHTAKQNNCILISQDKGMRILARLHNVDVEPYKYVRIQHELWNGWREFEVDSDYIDELYRNKWVRSIFSDSFTNEFHILKCGSQSAISLFKDDIECLVEPPKNCFGIKPRNIEQTLAMAAILSDAPLVSLIGPAGCGKSLLSLAASLEQKTKFTQILLTRPIISLSGKDLGFLPGSIEEKYSVFTGPFFDNLGVIKGASDDNRKKVDDMLENQKIKVEPMPYIRGRSFNKAILLVDEGQNTTPHEMKTIITRAGEGCKIIVQGDINQIDDKNIDKRSNGLSYLVDKMKGSDLYMHVALHKSERSKLAETAAKLL